MQVRPLYLGPSQTCAWEDDYIARQGHRPGLVPGTAKTD